MPVLSRRYLLDGWSAYVARRVRAIIAHPLMALAQDLATTLVVIAQTALVLMLGADCRFVKGCCRHRNSYGGAVRYSKG